MWVGERWRRLVIGTVLIGFVSAATSADVRAERVGFSFSGALAGSSSGTYTLFGVTVKKNAVITGTFSYDTTSVAHELEPGANKYPQSIHGGLALDIDNGALQLSAQDFSITVANDFEREPDDIIDYFGVDFDSREDPTPAPILVNGVPWAGTVGFISFQWNWPENTFAGGDEPKLTAERPTTPGSSSIAWLGSNTLVPDSSAPPRMFSITSVSAIDPVSGDFNCDGEFGPDDYQEWQDAYGQTGPEYQYADGNLDNIVDAADYTIWRNGLEGVPLLTSLTLSAPEPNGILLALVAAQIVACGARRRS